MIYSFTGEILSGKTLGRALFNAEVAHAARHLRGRTLDLAGGLGSYYDFLPSGLDIVRTNLRPSEGVDQVDFDKPLPFPDQSFDHVFLFNALYIVEDPPVLIREIRRVLKSGGTALVSSPFMQNEMPEPHDYRRLTREGLTHLFTASGFVHQEIVSYGERFSVGANLLHSFFYFSPLRVLVYALARALDRLIPERIRQQYPTPIGYFCVLTK